MEEWPEAVDEVDGAGSTPLLVALREYHRSVLDMARYLVPRSPDALRSAAADPTLRGRLPLHVVAARYVTPERAEDELAVVRTVAEGWPGAVRAADNEGNLPVHVALSNDASLEIVRYFVGQHPGSLRHRNSAGLLPVQVALSSWLASMDRVVPFLVEQRPESLQERDANGRVLLHYLAGLAPPDERLLPEEHAAFISVVPYVVEKWPGALRVRDSAGLLPLHVAASSATSTLDLVYRLARRRPETLVLRSGAVVGGGGGASEARGRSPSPVQSGHREEREDRSPPRHTKKKKKRARTDSGNC